MFNLLFTLVFSSSIFASESNCIHTDNHFNCVKYLRNYDGDTFSVDIPNVHPLIGKNISVRIVGVDTPEIKGEGKCEKEKARIAQKFVENILSKAKRIDLINVDRDKYFRVLADVQIDQTKILSKLLLENKLAYPYQGGKKEKRSWCN